MKISEKTQKMHFFQNSCTELAKIKNLHSTICLKVFPSSGRVALPPAFARNEQRGELVVSQRQAGQYKCQQWRHILWTATQKNLAAKSPKSFAAKGSKKFWSDARSSQEMQESHALLLLRQMHLSFFS